MGFRKVTVRESVAESIAAISFYLESEGLLAAAEKFTDDVYDFIGQLADNRKRHKPCRDSQRNLLGYKCVSFRKKYTIVFVELDEELIVCEFILSRRIHW